MLPVHLDLRSPGTVQLLREAYDTPDPTHFQGLCRFEADCTIAAPLQVTKPGEAKYFEATGTSSHECSVDPLSPFLCTNVDCNIPSTKAQDGSKPCPFIRHNNFSQKLVYLDVIQASQMSYIINDSPYCVVAKVSDRHDGTIDGIFAVPYNGTRGDLFVHSCDCGCCAWSDNWEPRVREKYY